jgi:signal transduction histidine kinase
LDYLWEWVQAKKRQSSQFSTLLLLTLRPDVKLITRHLWQSIDELVAKPIEKVELQARVEILLRSRQLSLELKVANELKSRFVSMVSHEFRNPLNVISVSAQILERSGDKWSIEKQRNFTANSNSF